MHKKHYTLNDIQPGEFARVKKINSQSEMKRRLWDLGLIENTAVECIGRSPAGEPTAFFIRVAVIAIRADDCADIAIEPIKCEVDLWCDSVAIIIW